MKKIFILTIIFLISSVVLAQETNIDYEIIAINDSVVLKQVKLLDKQLPSHLLQIVEKKKNDKTFIPFALSVISISF